MSDERGPRCPACGSTHGAMMCPVELQVVKQEHGEHGRHCSGCRELGYLTEISELRRHAGSAAVSGTDPAEQP